MVNVVVRRIFGEKFENISMDYLHVVEIKNNVSMSSWLKKSIESIVVGGSWQ